MADARISVMLPLPLDSLFTYRVPPALESRVAVGARVVVPFGRRRLVGIVASRDDRNLFDGDVKDVLAVLDKIPAIPETMVPFLRWMAAYYYAPVGEVVRCALPRPLFDPGEGRGIKLIKYVRLAAAPRHRLGRKARELVSLLEEKGEVPLSFLRERLGDLGDTVARLRRQKIVAIREEEVYRSPLKGVTFGPTSPPVLNADQHEAVRKVQEAIDRGEYRGFLLHGVTGSGKTEVYLQAIAHARNRGKSSLLLVPEISLTPLLVKRFLERFGGGIALLHSGMSEGERYDEWRRVRRGEADIVIGARSALFAPLEQIGMIVVDEEHDAGYKQSEGIRYHARDMALVRGKMESAVVMLGSATPSITTRYAADTGKLTLLSLPQRAVGSGMPEVTVISPEHKETAVHPQLISEIRERIRRKEQTILFLNRRGFAPRVRCRGCGNYFRCPNCSVSLTYHRGVRKVICHYCEFTHAWPPVCPVCGGMELLVVGRGTERIEEEIGNVFPEAKTGRLDRDTTSRRGSHAEILSAFERHELDILVGTQMIAKGHDYHDVTLVGILSADDTLSIPDLWSAERTFQLLTQVVGRSGRGVRRGSVFIETDNPGHYAISAALSNDYDRFYGEELQFRRDAGYPPYSRLVLIILTSNGEKELDSSARSMVSMLREARASLEITVDILGPAIPPLAMIRGRHRRHILLKSRTIQESRRLLDFALRRIRLPRTIRMAIDVDPVEIL